ncbi:DNA primase [Ruminococcus sp.]|uniref:DNA primase n=1 Tax=Ruminococcus sp. TaxID=41978 RepID=UPI0025DC2B17|nr:DNA primase [Ruminococcus sp.]MBQ8966432.1 DNA primase [Ruminococcus sp.]
MDQAFLEKLKFENPINEVMRENGIDLKLSGRGYMCKCPFHGEKTASCSVVPDKGFFHCFGCGVSGDVIAFVRKYRNLGFMDAINYLAQRAGLTVPAGSGDSDRSYKRRQRLYEMNKKAALFFRAQLKTPDGVRCLNYLMKQRKLDAATINKYGMGCAPNSWTALKIYMLGEGYSEDELIDASLIFRSQKNGNTYDFFVDRAMFPFIDVAGNIVGFGGRTLGDDKRKYLNTSDTVSEEYRRSGGKKTPDGYSKSRFVFSLNYAKDSAVTERKLLLCEGNLDVISLYQHGFKNAVASCGTALTPEQIKAMKTYADEIVICYDSDEAGQKAALRAIGLLRAGGMGSSVIRMEGAKDPDEYINKFGEDHFKYLLSNATDGFDFELEVFKRGLDLENRNDKTKFLRKAYHAIAIEPDDTARDTMERQLAEKYSVTFEVVRETVNKIAADMEDLQEKTEQREKERQLIQREDNRPTNKAFTGERGLIYYVYMNSDMAAEVSKQISPDEFTDEFNRRIFVSLLGKIAVGEYVTPETFLEEFTLEDVQEFKQMITKYDKLNVNREVAFEYIKSIKDYNRKHAPQNGETESNEDMLKKIEELMKTKGGSQ